MRVLYFFFLLFPFWTLHDNLLLVSQLVCDCFCFYLFVFVVVALCTQGARVWIPNTTTVWEGAQLVDNFHEGDKQLKIVCDAGDERVIEIRTDNDLPLLRNPAILIGQNDLTALSYLHEPDVLHTLEVRWVTETKITTFFFMSHFVFIRIKSKWNVFGFPHLNVFGSVLFAINQRWFILNYHIMHKYSSQRYCSAVN